MAYNTNGWDYIYHIKIDKLNELIAKEVDILGSIIPKDLVDTQVKGLESFKFEILPESSYPTLVVKITIEKWEIRKNSIGSFTKYDDTTPSKKVNITLELIKVAKKSSYDNFGERLLFAIHLLRSFPGTNIEGNINYKHFLESLTYYGNFLVDIINASESKDMDVKLILDKYALPVSSYKVKRYNATSWDISAYPGLYVGYEFNDSKSTNFGITAPIGFTYSWKNGDAEAELSSSSIFLSAIDIGAPFSYRFANDGAEGLPETIRWQQIFSPGLHYVYGFKNSPLALNFGTQFSPMLRDINNDGTNIDDSQWRVQLALTVDIPIFNLNKS